MILRIVRRIDALTPRFVQRCYDYVSELTDDGVLTVMNYGFEAGCPTDDGHFGGLNLYEHLVANADLAGKLVVEVGSGRGGGCTHIAGLMQPRAMIGMDLSTRAARFCRASHRAAGLSFMAGDAEHVPLRSSSADVVLNVESSHSYGHFRWFAGEVFRVLRPGGLFLHADFRPVEKVPSWRHDLLAPGFEVVDSEDITEPVLAALRRHSGTKEAMIRARVPVYWRPVCRRVAAVAGSSQYRDFAEGRDHYWRFTLRKPRV